VNPASEFSEQITTNNKDGFYRRRELHSYAASQVEFARKVRIADMNTIN
jgi:hypothetical protein